jgi:hypothetical protein
MDVKKILFIVFILIILYYLITYLTTSSNTLITTTTPGTTQTIITPSTISGNSLNFYYSIWFYINSWNTDAIKVLFQRGTMQSPCPKVYLGQVENNLFVEMAVTSPIDDTTEEDGTKIFTSPPVINIPLQSWVNVIVGVNGRSMDIYINGKLVTTDLLTGVPTIDSTESIYVCPTGYGFDGYTSLFQYWDSTIDPQTAFNIYSKGYTGSSFGGVTSALSKYSIKFSLLEGDTETSSITI